MSYRRKTICNCLVILNILAFLFSCASKPQTEPIAQEEQDEENSDRLQYLEQLGEKAKGAIARAELAGAAELSSELLDAAYLNLRNGQEKDPKKEEAAKRDQYLAAIDKANQAYDDAVAQSKDRWLTIIQNYEDDLDQLNSALYIPKYDARSRELLGQLRNQISEGDNNEESLALFQSTIPNVDAVVSALVANLDWLDQLRQETAGLMGEAGRQSLRGEAANLEAEGRAAYDSALGHRSRGDMQSMEQDLFDGRYYLRKALRSSGYLDLSNVDRLLQSVRKRLEVASQLIVVDADGIEIEVKPWNGADYLEQNPLLDLNEKIRSDGARRPDESKLQQPEVSNNFFPVENQTEVDIPANSVSFQSRINKTQLVLLEDLRGGGGNILEKNAPLSFNSSWELHAVTQLISEVPEDNRLDGSNSREGDPFANNEELPIESYTNADTALPENLEDEEVEPISAVSVPENLNEIPQAPQAEETVEEDLLDNAPLLLKQAISSWENGVLSRNDGNLPKAQHYFEEASRLIDQYNVEYAILGYYTVRRLSPEDCLWRIAGYSDIYGDPYQWTRIYQRNRDIISNPSLIYPGQRLIIPPPKDQ